MAYIVQPGRQVHDRTVYVEGDVYPAMKGAIPDLVADGAVAWETVEKPAPEPKDAPPPTPVAKKPAAKRKAVKR
jgi:hypothetical protein